MEEQAGWDRGYIWVKGQMGLEWPGYEEPYMLINKRESWEVLSRVGSSRLLAV